MSSGAHSPTEEKEESEFENKPVAYATKVKIDNPVELVKKEEEESEDELLLTTKTNKQLQKEITIQQTKKNIQRV